MFGRQRERGREKILWEGCEENFSHNKKLINQLYYNEGRGGVGCDVGVDRRDVCCGGMWET